MITCPVDRPVKCASDLSCRSSISQCPDYSSSETQTKNFLAVGTHSVCPTHAPLKCEDGTCSSTGCNEISASDSLDNLLSCMEDKTKSFCWSSLKCVDSLENECPALRSSVKALSLKQPLKASQCQANNTFICEDDPFNCQEAPCQEWTACPEGQTQCWDGLCVTDPVTCAN